MQPENTQTYNYRAFSENKSITEQISSLLKSSPSLVWFVIIGEIVFMGPFLFVGIIAIITGLVLKDMFPILFGLSFCVITILMTLVFLKWLLRAHQIDIKAKAFAKDNNIIILENNISPNYSGTLFRQSNFPIISLGYVLQQTPLIELGNITLKNTSNNSNSALYGYIRLELSKNLPHIMLDNVKNNAFGQSMPLMFADNQKVSLEGNFNSFYTVYAPQGYEQDALYLLTPDVMHALTQLPKPYDVEIIDNQIYLYRYESFNLASEQEIKEVLETIAVILKEIGKQSVMYSDDTVPAQAGNIVSATGQRLNKKFNVVGAVVAIVIFVLSVSYTLLMIFTT